VPERPKVPERLKVTERLTETPAGIPSRKIVRIQ
jgi:hypothetical protein